MRRAGLALLALLGAAGPVLARDPVLKVPIDCDLETTCHIQQYVDADPGPGQADFMCGPLTYDGHQGTDFALPTLAMMTEGVAVYAAAPGTVRGVRDDMIDILADPEDRASLEGRECGNGVLIRHGDGWETQYCHLKRGSVAVTPGQRVSAATQLGEVGLSGLTGFPHLHLSVRHRGETVDPFAPDRLNECGATPTRTLWQNAPDYVPGGIISAGFSSAIPSFEAVKAGTAARDRLTSDDAAIVLWGFAFGGREGDDIAIEISTPQGETLVEQTITLEKTQAQLFRAIGHRAPVGGWLPGTYRGVVTILRAGEVLDRAEISIPVTR